MTTCRSAEGGSPLCPLGSHCVTTEIRGKSLFSIEMERELNRPYCDDDELDREYDLMIILDAPPRDDDVAGTIGHGRIIPQLIELIERARFNKKKVFVTYQTRCHITIKRKPSVQETKACSPYLLQDLQRINPKVVMPLGATCLRAFRLTGQGGIKAVRGKAFERPFPDDESGQQWIVLPSVDPGSLYHEEDPMFKQKVQQDYNKAKVIADTGVIQEPPPHFAKFKVCDTIESVEELCKELRSAGVFAFDTESRSLPWDKEPATCISLCWGYEEDSEEIYSAVVPFYNHDPNGSDWLLKPTWQNGDRDKVLALLRDIFEDESIAKAAHFTQYDINVFRKHFDIKINGFLYDTLIMHHLLDENSIQKLEYLADIEFAVGDYSKELHDIVGHGTAQKTYDHIPDHTLWPYAATDAECCYRLMCLYYSRLQDKPHLWKLYCEENNEDLKTLSRAEWHGAQIDLDVAEDLKTDYERKSDKLLASMRSVTWSDFNPNSTKDVIKAITALGFEDKIKDSKKANGYTTDKNKLGELKRDLPFAGEVLEYRNTTKMLGTYLNPLEDDLSADGRLRKVFLIHGTTSGRLSNRFFHQLPRVDKQREINLRDMIVAREGYKIVYYDYSQIELRIAAILAKDPEMIRLLFHAVDEDVHEATAFCLLEGLVHGINKFNRQLGKNCNFGLIYGSEGYRLIATNQWEDPDGNRWPITWDIFTRGMTNFQQKFPFFKEYLDNLPDLARYANGVHTTPFGRERHMRGKLNDTREGVRKAAEREIVNFSVQSPANSVTKRTNNLIRNYIDQYVEAGHFDEWDCFLFNTVHDSGSFEVRDDLVDWFVKDVLTPTAHRKIEELDNYSFPCKVGIGQSWSEAEANADE